MKGMKRILTGVVLSLFLVVPAFAGGILDFGVIAPTGGTISYAGGAAPLIGANITVDNVTGLGTTLNNNISLTITDGLWNFTSGLFIPTGSTEEWFFAAGGPASITLVGTIAAQTPVGGTPFAGTSGTLFSGQVLAMHVDKLSSSLSVLDLFVDIKNPDLLAYYGLPTNVSYIGGISGVGLIPVPSNVVPPNGFSSNPILSGDITNTPEVPEPGILILLGMGLSAVGLLSRRITL